MPADIVLPTAVRVVRPGSGLLVLRTVGQTIDWIQTLPKAIRQRDHWRAVFNILVDAAEKRDIRLLNHARSDLVNALRVEQWLPENWLMRPNRLSR